MNEMEVIITLSKLGAMLCNSNKDYESVKLAKEAMVAMKSWNVIKAGEAMEKMYWYIAETIYSDTRESFFLKRLINKSKTETDKIFK